MTKIDAWNPCPTGQMYLKRHKTAYNAWRCCKNGAFLRWVLLQLWRESGYAKPIYIKIERATKKAEQIIGKSWHLTYDTVNQKDLLVWAKCFKSEFKWSYVKKLAKF